MSKFRKKKCFLIVLILTIAFGVSKVNALDFTKIVDLNPSLAEMDYPENLLHLSFQVEAETGKIVSFKGLFGYDQGWYPWFDQAKDQPRHEMVTGRFYTQEIIVKESLNFLDLKNINPSLKHYQQIDPLVSEDGTKMLMATEGAGIAFVTDVNGDIHALLRITFADKNGELPPVSSFPSDRAGESTHPFFGNIAYTFVYLQDPEGKYDIDQWLRAAQLEEIKTELGTKIDQGFVFERLELSSLMGMVKAEGTLRNESGRDYLLLGFEIVLFDNQGNIVGEGLLQAQNSKNEQSSSFIGMLSVEAGTDIENLTYSITFSYGM